MQKICTTHLNLFEPTDHVTITVAPFDAYLFLIDARSTGYGGLEHRSSTALVTTREALPNFEDNTLTRRKAYTDLLGLISHEYFHTWNASFEEPMGRQRGTFRRQNSGNRTVVDTLMSGRAFPVDRDGNGRPL